MTHRTVGHIMLAALAITIPVTGSSAEPLARAGIVVPVPAHPVAMRLAIVKTAEARSTAGLLYAQGDPFQGVTVNYSAVLVQHPQGTFLFDSGLGRQINAQVSQDMAWFARPFFTYRNVRPARDQMDSAGLPPVPRVILSHAHWDHASGVVDFPEAEIWATAGERAFIDSPRRKAVFASQVQPASIRWRSFDLTDKPFAGFARSLDLYGDGSAVLVGMPGHTPGSVGLFLSPASGRQYFFCSDVVWAIAGVLQNKPKFWIASRLVDHDADATMAGIRQLHALMIANPSLVVVPAHDAATQAAVGYFPQWRQ